ncbi:flagellar hook-associated protein FlgK [Croceicoccus gelatinilyticus]|uniref:flagellar hook-associated protein FlgK n=1 Tax=Croceicoccus gelatinilyticus TaxID=2835536 RepID=UPI001BCB9D77|nr:flagellar hook-associated protein FlgK [Croceicoccus gelatinilyticus]MBS7671321.1 flagellar hook-associated protein FlgK [Croceicoccus gelatinilyticus]
MASDLISIARSGTRTARMALDVAAHNIANASTEGYVRRTVRLEEIGSSNGVTAAGKLTLSGVSLGGVIRNADAYRQSEVRRTGADVARANAELEGLKNIEVALEESGLYDGIVGFEASLKRLESDPVDPALRAGVVEAARAMASSFNLADNALKASSEGTLFAAKTDVDQVNTLAAELGRINLKLSRSPVGSGDQASLLDRRDTLLGELSQKVGIHTSIGTDQNVEIRIGDSSGPLLLSGFTSSPFTMTTAADGTLSFAVGGTAVVPGAGSLAGHAQSLDMASVVQGRLDDLAVEISTIFNNSQAGGAALDGTAGSPLFGGTGAADMSLLFQDGRMITTAPAGSPANSRDTSQLAALNAALTSNGVAADMDSLLFDVSAAVSGRTVTRDTLVTIADNAEISFRAQAGVDLDEEAVNLVRFQQAFQASGRVMQVASDTFNSILGIR